MMIDGALLSEACKCLITRPMSSAHPDDRLDPVPNIYQDETVKIQDLYVYSFNPFRVWHWLASDFQCYFFAIIQP